MINNMEKIKKMSEEKSNSPEYKSYSLNVNRVNSLKNVLEENGIFFASDANAINIAINKFITDFRLNSK